MMFRSLIIITILTISIRDKIFSGIIDKNREEFKGENNEKQK